MRTAACVLLFLLSFGCFGLDFNLEVFPVENPELRLLQKTVNMLHFPAPAVKFSERHSPSYFLFHTN